MNDGENKLSPPRPMASGEVSIDFGNSVGGITIKLTPAAALDYAGALISAAKRAELLKAEADEIAEATDRIRAKYRGEKVA